MNADKMLPVNQQNCNYVEVSANLSPFVRAELRLRTRSQFTPGRIFAFLVAFVRTQNRPLK
jgi:hypothetical protein